MELTDIGFSEDLNNYIIENSLESFIIGRVMAEHKERYVVLTADFEYEAEILGNLRFTAKSRRDFPAVGDWVAMQEYDKGKAIIHTILPRKTIIERQAVGKQAEKQIIATNVNVAFIVQAIDRDFSLNRIERYLTICYNSQVEPVVILNKIDLIKPEQIKEILDQINERVKDVKVFALSNANKEGFADLESFIEGGKSYCLLGSSGVGKSTLVNNLSDRELMKTAEIGEQTQRGKHVTSHRELIILKGGGIIIDNPGMRELGIADSELGLEHTFEIIEEAAENCRYDDCKHINEDGCEVLKLVEEGEIDKALYKNFIKMELEKQHYEQDELEKRHKEKDFGKMMKSFKKDIKKLSNKHEEY